MTKVASIKTADVDQYRDYDLHQLETVIKTLHESTPSPSVKRQASAVRQALRQRMRLLKAQVMEFEQTNDHHLLIFDSTDNFSKIAGRSVLFYTLTIADRIHRRYNVKNDTDDYSRSDEGIVSIRSREQLHLQLGVIDIHPDEELSTSELHFYKLPKTYNEEQIAKLHDRSRQDIERITSLILPRSPLPDLYQLILDLNRNLYHHCKRISDSLARETLVHQIILDANEMLVGYLNFANAKTNSGIVHYQSQISAYATVASTIDSPSKPQSAKAQNLFQLLLSARNLRNNMANLENLRLLHHRELCTILEQLVEIERLTGREYAKQLHRDQNPKPNPPNQTG